MQTTWVQTQPCPLPAGRYTCESVSGAEFSRLQSGNSCCLLATLRLSVLVGQARGQDLAWHVWSPDAGLILGSSGAGQVG